MCDSVDTLMHVLKDGWMAGCIDGCLSEWMHGWMSECLHERIDA